MSNDKKYIWKDYFESKIYGDYSKKYKDILRLVDKELMIKYPNEYMDKKSESKKTHNDYKFFTDDIGVTTLSYPHMVCEFDFRSIYPIIDMSIKLELIHWNKDKDCVFVKLMDGRSTVVKRYGDTKDDIYAAVAYAIAKIEFKTNSNFKKEVDSHLKIKETKKNG